MPRKAANNLHNTTEWSEFIYRFCVFQITTTRTYCSFTCSVYNQTCAISSYTVPVFSKSQLKGLTVHLCVVFIPKPVQ